MHRMLSAALTIAGGYLVGSIASAIIVCRLFGLPDPRSDGSGNPGATNVLRLGGKKAAAITLLGDVLKGLLPVLLAAAMNQSADVIGATAVAAFLGHLFPVFLASKAAKASQLRLALWSACPGSGWRHGTYWLLVAAISRYSSLSSLIAVSLMPVYLWYFTGAWALVVAGVVIAVFTIARHHGNIRRLLAGEEPKIGKKKATA